MPNGKPRIDDAFFEELREWSKIKLRIVSKYLRAYVNIRHNQSVVHYVDGFAGPGHYGPKGGAREEGSPVIVARFAQERLDAGEEPRLLCHFTEQRPDYCEELQETVTEIAPDVCWVRCGAFRDHLPAIVGAMGTAPAICFLDPFGVKPLVLEDLRPLLQRSDTELVLNLNTPRLRQMAGFEDSAARDAAAKLALVSRVLGEDSASREPEWLREYYRLGKDGIRWEEWAARRYCDLLVREGRYLKYAVPYAIRPGYGKNPKYYLVFASRSEKPFPVLNDLVCTEEDGLFDKVASANDGLQMGLGIFETVDEDRREERFAELQKLVHAYGLENQGCSREDIYAHFSRVQFGVFRKRHYRAVVNRLVDNKLAVYGPGEKETAPITFTV